jgi:predicted  nucleic acid-binding Zn-ribbon protein
MDTQEFERIKKKIEILKEKRAKANGAIENILDTWKKQYSINSIEEAQEQLESLQSEYDVNNTKIDSWYEELKGLTNWSLVG